MPRLAHRGMWLALARLLLEGPLEKHMALPNSRSIARPAKDEWGVYDPQQAGLAALFARLDANAQHTPAPAPAAKKEIADYPAPAVQGFRDE